MPSQHARSEQAADADARLATLLAVLGAGSLTPIHERVAEGLRRAITLGLFADQRLPAERQLASLLGVSRITVRQSLERLRRDGQVTVVKGRHGGNYATPLRQRPGPTWSHVVDSAHQDINEIQAFRSIVEPVAAQLAAQRSGTEHRARLRAAVTDLGKAGDADAFRRADSEFHVTIAEAASNARLLGAIVAARAELLIWRDLLPMPDDLELNAQEHHAIAEAIAAGNAAEAYALMREHLESARQSFWREVERYRRREQRRSSATAS